MKCFLFFLFCLLIKQNVFADKDSPYAEGEILIRTKPGFQSNLNVGSEVKNIQNFGSKKTKQSQVQKVVLKNTEEVKSEVNRLQNSGYVVYAEPNYYYYKTEDFGESFSVKDWENLVLKGLGKEKEEDKEFLRAFKTLKTHPSYQKQAIWFYIKNHIHFLLSDEFNEDKQEESRPIVAVIDSGIDLDHFVFKETNAFWVNKDEIMGNGIDDDNNGYIDDRYGWDFVQNQPHIKDIDGHGTHVSGIVLKAALDIAPPNKNFTKSPIRIMPLRFLTREGRGKVSNAIAAIYYAVNNGAKIINASWGGKPYSASLHEALAYAYEKEVLIVTSSGNEYKNNDESPMYPSNFDVPSILSVGSISNNSDVLSNFSNFGLFNVDILAPGGLIYSAYPGRRMHFSSGTSMAAPLVAGTAAITKVIASHWTGFQLKENILNTATQIEELKEFVSQGKRLNIIGAFENARKNAHLESSQPEYNFNLKYHTRSLASDLSAHGGSGCASLLLPQFALLGKVGRSIRVINKRNIWKFIYLSILLISPLFLLFLFRRAIKRKQKRRYLRFRFKSSALIEFRKSRKEKNFYNGETFSLSMGGLAVNTKANLKKGDDVYIYIRNLEISGKIVWKNKNCYGIVFY